MTCLFFNLSTLHSFFLWLSFRSVLFGKIETKYPWPARIKRICFLKYRSTIFKAANYCFWQQKVKGNSILSWKMVHNVDVALSVQKLQNMPLYKIFRQIASAITKWAATAGNFTKKCNFWTDWHMDMVFTFFPLKIEFSITWRKQFQPKILLKIVENFKVHSPQRMQES